MIPSHSKPLYVMQIVSHARNYMSRMRDKSMLHTGDIVCFTCGAHTRYIRIRRSHTQHILFRMRNTVMFHMWRKMWHMWRIWCFACETRHVARVSVVCECFVCERCMRHILFRMWHIFVSHARKCHVSHVMNLKLTCDAKTSHVMYWSFHMWYKTMSHMRAAAASHVSIRCRTCEV